MLCDVALRNSRLDIKRIAKLLTMAVARIWIIFIAKSRLDKWAKTIFIHGRIQTSKNIELNCDTMLRDVRGRRR